MMSLNKYKLADIAKIEISGVDKKTIEGEIPVRLCNFVDVYYNWAITKEKAKSFMVASAKQTEIDKCSIGKGMVAITKDSETRDDIGVATYIADDFDNVVLGYHCALIIPNSAVVDGKYLNAFMHTRYIQKYFENNASGSGQRYTLSNDTIGNIPVLLPSIDEQHTIGKVLADIDRKIELNKRINDNLEAMAKQLYDYWFVQFDFPNEDDKPYKSSGGAMVWNDKLKREIPQGWNTVVIGDILDKYPATKRYETKEYLPQGNYPIVDQGDSYIVGFTNERENLLVRHPAVLFGDHSTKVKFLDFDFARGADGTQILYSSIPEVSQYYLYLALKSMSIPNPGYSRHFKYLKEMPIIAPSIDVAKAFSEIVTPLFKQWTNNVFGNIVLTKQRDELLPLLINGQASVNYHLSDD